MKRGDRVRIEGKLPARVLAEPDAHGMVAVRIPASRLDPTGEPQDVKLPEVLLVGEESEETE